MADGQRRGGGEEAGRDPETQGASQEGSPWARTWAGRLSRSGPPRGLASSLRATLVRPVGSPGYKLPGDKVGFGR